MIEKDFNASRHKIRAEKQWEKEPKKTKQEQVCDYIHDNYVAFNRLRYDVIARKVQVRRFSEDAKSRSAVDEWQYITDADINSIVCDCCAETGVNVTAREVLTMLHAGSSYIPHVHPLREYINGLRAYTNDQPDWIDIVAQHVRVKVSGDMNESDASVSTVLQKRWRVCFKKWFVAMVASWLDDQVVNHAVLVLIGRQGCYKTTWLESLIPPHLRNYCCKMTNTTQLNKDDRLRIAEFGLINMDELDAMGNRELNTIKSVITATDVNERAAYGYTKERRVRLASFCASSNKKEFLTDMTGNRRWLPFEVEEIQSPFLTTLPYDRMYAQARWLIEHGFNHWFDSDDIAVMEEHNEAFRMLESEEELLPILFDIPAEGKGEFMTCAQISERLVSYGNIKKPLHPSRLGTVLGKNGYRSVVKRIGGWKTRGWLVYQRNTDEIQALKKDINV